MDGRVEWESIQYGWYRRRKLHCPLKGTDGRESGQNKRQRVLAEFITF